jgi:DMSO reductase family type II enzyme molybdopterin subunit
MSTELSRRAFIRGAGTAVLTLSLGQLTFRPPKAAGSVLGAVETGDPSYGGFGDLYRERWTWDRVAKGTHFVNCWYQRGCNWNVFVKDGLVLREEQDGTYPQTNPSVPDFNPRGCQKGACYSQQMYSPSRLKYPLKRVGARGEGKWQRVSWDEALRDVADRMIESLEADGPGSIIWDFGTAASNGCNGLGLFRTNFLLDTPMLDANAEIGDHHPGAAVTCGKITFASSGDDLFYSDVILMWGGNPIYTQIPNAHFINEARYNGATVVAIAPDYNPSSIHADMWVPVDIGTDAALGLSLAQVIIEEGLHAPAFLKEQTDFPFLVRKDTRRFLRAQDLEAGGAEDVFYVFDRASGEIHEAPRRSLALEGIDPALDGEYSVKTVSGEVEVTPVFSLFRERLSAYTPEAASKITGTDPEMIRDLARRIGRARAATILTQSNFSKFYHGLEMERAQILVLALCGQIGKKGSGFNAFPWLNLGSGEPLNVAPGSVTPKLGLIALAAQAIPGLVRAKIKGHTNEMFLYEAARHEYSKGGFLPSPLFFHREGGLDANSGRSQEWDPYMKRDLNEYLEESVEKGWQTVPTTRPRILFEVGGNIFRRVRGYDKLYEGLLPKLELLVTVDWRMSNTALHSDYVFPAAGWYEKDDITWATPISPFAHVTTAAVEPLGEAKSDWVFHCLLMKTVQRRAKEKGTLTFRDRAGEERRLDQIYDDLTFGQRFTEENPEDMLREIMDINTNLGGKSWDELKEKGFERYTELGMSFANIGTATDIEPDETITANTWHIRDKQPWPTLTRRMQFYIDQEFFIELGEELPIHKDNPPIGGNYPLKMTGGHTRWSIHASWRDEANLLRLQRGEPLLIIGPDDAGARGIEDGDLARARNDVGSFEVRVKVSPHLRPGQVVVYHAWEPYQFKNRQSYQTTTPSPLNPIQLAGGYFHLQPMMIQGEPGMTDRGTRIEVERLDPSGRPGHVT